MLNVPNIVFSVVVIVYSWCKVPLRSPKLILTVFFSFFFWLFRAHYSHIQTHICTYFFCMVETTKKFFYFIYVHLKYRISFLYCLRIVHVCMFGTLVHNHYSNGNNKVTKRENRKQNKSQHKKSTSTFFIKEKFF